MRAIGFYKYGGPEVLEMIEAENPRAGEGEMVIRVISTSVNRLDTLVRMGYHGAKIAMPHVPGIDVVGRVEEVGNGACDISVGEMVIANNVYGCNTCMICKSGNESSCIDWKLPGLQTWGSYGELMKVPSRMVMKAPGGFSVDELATMPLSYAVSWKVVNKLAKAIEGETIVVRGASGNIGIFSILISKSLGLKVIALSRNEEKFDSLRKIGAGHVIDYRKGKDYIKKEIMELTEGRGADIAIDSFGATLNDSIYHIRNSGRVVLLGSITGTESKVDTKAFYLKNVTVMGMHNTNMNEFAEAFEFAQKNRIKPVIAKTMPIKEARKAHELLESSSCFGKIVLRH